MDEGFDFGEAVKEAMKEGYADGGIARIGLKKGSGMSRRTFLKFLAGAASIPIVGKIFKPLKIGIPIFNGLKILPTIGIDAAPAKNFKNVRLDIPDPFFKPIRAIPPSA